MEFDLQHVTSHVTPPSWTFLFRLTSSKMVLQKQHYQQVVLNVSMFGNIIKLAYVTKWTITDSLLKSKIIPCFDKNKDSDRLE